MNEIIDLGFIAAKLAAIKDEKARMMVDGASLIYNAAQVTRFRSMIVELSQYCNYIVFSARMRGEYTEEERRIVMECQRQIEECYQRMAKHDTMTLLDCISLLIEGFNQLSRK